MAGKTPIFFGIVLTAVVLVFVASTRLAAQTCSLELRIEPTEGALRSALDQVTANGCGRITFDARNTDIEIADQIDFHGNNLVLDGEDRNLRFHKSPAVTANPKEGEKC